MLRIIHCHLLHFFNDVLHRLGKLRRHFVKVFMANPTLPIYFQLHQEMPKALSDADLQDFYRVSEDHTPDDGAIFRQVHLWHKLSVRYESEQDLAGGLILILIPFHVISVD